MLVGPHSSLYKGALRYKGGVLWAEKKLRYCNWSWSCEAFFDGFFCGLKTRPLPLSSFNRKLKESPGFASLQISNIYHLSLQFVVVCHAGIKAIR
jgi:hypothetical protein